MHVKSSHRQCLTRLTMALLASVSLSACQSTGIADGSLWRDINGEREPQVVLGGRRAPVLNQQIAANYIQSAQVEQSSATNAPQAFSPYENQPEYQPSAPDVQEPHLLDRVTGWFSSQFESTPAPTRPMEESEVLSLASNTSPAPLTPVDFPPIDNRKPIASNPIAVMQEEAQMRVADVQLSAPVPPAHPNGKARDKTGEILSIVEAAPAPALQVASTQEPTPFPWGKEAPLSVPTPPTMPSQQQLSAMMPAAGGRKDQTELTLDEVSEEEFATIIEAPSQHTPAKPSVEVDLAQMEPPTELGMGGPFFASAEEETLLASSSAMEMAAAEPQYPPLTSVPTAPQRIEEIRAEHPAVKAELEADKAQADISRQQILDQITEEADESLLIQVPESQLSPAAGGNMGMLVALPPAQFDHERWSGPRIFASVPVPVNFSPTAHAVSKAPIVQAKAEAPNTSEATIAASSAADDNPAIHPLNVLSVLPQHISLPVLREDREVVYHIDDIDAFRS